MKLSTTFLKTLRTVSKEETAQSAQYLLRAGYVHKELAGVYSYLPLGLRTLENIKTVIRTELNSLGCEELLLTTLQPPEIWQKSGRWDSEKMDIWFKTDLAAGGQLGLAPTHEEPITHLLRTYINSYKDLPVYAYQFQTKFRNELRAKSGILRTREFLMKDLYSFSPDQETHDRFYHQIEQAYANIYRRLGLGDCTFQTFASGGVFSKYSHEFQTILPVGEDTIYYNEDKSIFLNEEVVTDEVLKEFNIQREDLQSTRAAEVGNIFSLGTKYTEALGLEFTGKDGRRHPAIMGCYGIGVSRVMGVIAEKFSDEKGLVWPEAVAPFRFHLIGIGENGMKKAAELYARYPDSVLFDDRDLRPGEKFADADLIGLPIRLVISDKTVKSSEVEVVFRKNHVQKLLHFDEISAKLIDMAQ